MAKASNPPRRPIPEILRELHELMAELPDAIERERERRRSR